MQQVYADKYTALKQFKEYLKDLGVSRIMLVRGGNSYVACGAADVLTPIFKDLKIETIVFNDFSVNPKWDDASKGRDILIKNRCECIVAVGGGSAMDIAKLIRYFAISNEINVPLVAIPTTAGTGAEATHFAVAYKYEEKLSIEDADILPDIAVIYSPFTYRNNKYLTACAGFDALAQAIEAYWNKNATAESDKYVIAAIRCLINQLPQCVQHPNIEKLRDDLALGAYLAGCAINITKTTAPHAFSYAFTSKCGYPHGHAVALTFPFFAEYNTQLNTQRDMALRKMIGIDENISIKEFFLQYLQQIGLTYKGTNGYDLMELLNAVNMQRLANNPIAVDESVKYQLYEFLNK